MTTTCCRRTTSSIGSHPRRPRSSSTVLGGSSRQGIGRRLLVWLHDGLLQGRGRLHAAHGAVQGASASPWMGRSTRRSPAVGSNLGIFDPHWVVELNYYCDTYGMDTISFGTADRLRHGVLRSGHPRTSKHRRAGAALRQRGSGARELLHQMAAGRGLWPHRRAWASARMKRYFAEAVRRRSGLPAGHRHGSQGAGVLANT